MPITIRGKNFTIDTLTQNISAGGVLSCIKETVEAGDNLDFKVEMAAAGSSPAEKPTLTAHGFVTRTRILNDGACEFAAKFTRTKLV